MILGPTYKTQSAQIAYNRIKGAVKKQVITFEDIIPPISEELKQKRIYMQSPEFWNRNNVKTFEIGKSLAEVSAKLLKIHGC